ncbi:MAG: kelch repeat-containing protein [Thermoplasmata archaeon]
MRSDRAVRRFLPFSRGAWVVGIGVLALFAFPLPGAGGLSFTAPALGHLEIPGSSTSQLGRALSSLERGGGPAEGRPLACSVSTLGSYGCAATTPSAPAVNTPAWAALDPGPSSLTPFYRESYAMVWDASDGYVLLFGGETLYRTPLLLADTWTYSNDVWTQLHPAIAPSARDGSMIAYDNATQSVVLFGGFVESGSSASDTNDTWTYHAGSWTNVTGGAAPSPRWGGGLAYDAADGYLLLFGGYSQISNQGLSDSWTYSHGAWSRLTRATSPAGRFGFGMVYDGAMKKVVLFGGQNATTQKTYSDTWTFSAGNWTQLSFVAPTPDGRSEAAMAFSYSLNEAILFGGFNSTPVRTLGDTWTFGALGWNEVTTVAPPAGRVLCSAVDDETAGTVLIFAGVTGAGQSLRDTWAFDGATWSRVTTPGYPDATSNFAATYDARDNYVLIFGGLNYSGDRVASTWTYSDGNWTELTPATSPSARTGAGMAFDVEMNEVILFGGNATVGGFQDDTWTFAQGNWTNITATAGTPPLGRAVGAMAYDDVTASVILFGGFGYNSSSKSDEYLSDTWSFSNGTWSKLTLANAPSARSGAAIAFDPEIGDLVLFGGIIDGKTLGQDTWTFSGTEWTQVTQPGGNGPSGRGFAQAAYDPHTHAVILFGGYGTAQLVPFNDTWSFAGGVWTYLPESVSPPARAFGTLVYDAESSYLLLWGGDSTALSPPFAGFADMWILDSIGASVGALPTSGEAPLTVAFTGMAHHAYGTYTYLWSFGDGTTSNIASPSHVFNFVGNYTVTLTVTDELGASGSSTTVITVTPTPQVPALSIAVSASPISGETPVAVAFATAVTGGLGNFTYSWVFGDGNLSSLASPIHNYTKVGTFHPTLWVNDTANQSVSETLTVTVSPNSIVPPPHTTPTNTSASANGFSSTWLAIGLLVGLVIGAAVAYLVTGRRRGRRPAVHPYGALTVPPPTGGLGTGPPPPWREGPP